MKIEQWSIDRIRPYEKNPRRNDKAVAAVADSIHQFGFRQPIVVDGDGVIMVGHTRYKAAVKLGLEKGPVYPASRCVNFTFTGPPILDTLAIVSAS